MIRKTNIFVVILTAYFSASLFADDVLFELLSRIDHNDPVTANLQRIEAQMLLDSLPKFPGKKLVDVVLDAAHNPDGRVLALELLEDQDPKRSASLDRRLIDDPVGGLRYNAVMRIITKAGKLLEDEKQEEAAVIYHALLSRAAALDQTSSIVRALLKINNKKPLTELGIEYGGSKDSGYLIHWEVSEPYDNLDGKGLDTVYLPEKSNTNVTWKPMETDNIDGKLNLFPFTDKKTNVSLYARTVLESPIAKTVSVRYSTQKTGKVWLNGKEIGYFPLNDDGGDVPDKYIMEIELQAGRNVLLIKNTRYSETPPAPVTSGDSAVGGSVGSSAGGYGGGMGGWLFQVRVCDTNGVPLSVADSEKQSPLPDSVFDRVADSETENNFTAKNDADSDKTLLGKENSTIPFMQFRGGSSNPVFKTVSCSENVFGKIPIWKMPIPGEGVSSPIVVKDRIIVTSADGPGENRLHTAAYDLGTGRKVWQRTLKATGSQLCYRPFSSIAANTPASDGEHVVAFFSSNDLACFLPEGKLLWYRSLGLENPEVIVSVGMAASPLIVDKTLIVQCQSNAASFAEAMDVSTGKTIWKIERPKGQGWSSPTVLPQKDGSNLIVFVDRTGCAVHSLVTGEKLTVYEGKCALTASPVCTDATVYFSLGGTTALRYDSVEKAPEILWTEPKLSVGSPSPVIDGNKLYIIKSPGILMCADRTSGEIFWQTRLSGSFYATPIILGSHLIAVSQQGMMYNILLHEEKSEILENIELGEDILSTPAVSDNSILIRSKKALYRFGLL